MTNKEIIAVVQAAEAGKTIECRSIGSNGEWVLAHTWCFDICEYRVKIREFYATEYPIIGPVGGRLYGDYETARIYSKPIAKIIKLQEVLES